MRHIGLGFVRRRQPQFNDTGLRLHRTGQVAYHRATFIGQTARGLGQHPRRADVVCNGCCTFAALRVIPIVQQQGRLWPGHGFALLAQVGASVDVFNRGYDHRRFLPGVQRISQLLGVDAGCLIVDVHIQLGGCGAPQAWSERAQNDGCLRRSNGCIDLPVEVCGGCVGRAIRG